MVVMGEADIYYIFTFDDDNLAELTDVPIELLWFPPFPFWLSLQFFLMLFLQTFVVGSTALPRESFMRILSTYPFQVCE